MEILRKAGDLLSAIREKRPLVHHITNYVTMNDCANIVLAVGGSPIMANDPAEAAEVTAAASALVLNLGTPSAAGAEAMLSAGRAANEKGIPVVMDPVGVGLTEFRRTMAAGLLKQVKPSIIRGNTGEILHLSGMDGCSHGVDSGNAPNSGAGCSKKVHEAGIEAAAGLALKHGCIVALTGKTDVVTDGRTVYLINNGTGALSRVTGTGCMTTSLAGAFLSVSGGDHICAAVAGVAAMGIAGQLADNLTEGMGIGTFRVKLFDSIYNLDGAAFLKYGDVKEFEYPVQGVT